MLRDVPCEAICQNGNNNATTFYASLAVAQDAAITDNLVMGTNNRIKALRDAKNMSAERLADLTGLSQSFLSRLESGKRKLTEEYILDISNALGCTPNELLGVSPSVNVTTERDKLRNAIKAICRAVDDVQGTFPPGLIADAVLDYYDRENGETDPDREAMKTLLRAVANPATGERG